MNSSALLSGLRRSARPREKFLWSRNWACPSCRTAVIPNARFVSSNATLAKPYYITTPIFYVNAEPHVGHFYTMVLTDILKRWQLLKGRKALLCTGTDEHGMKIQRAAAAANEDPKKFCDEVSEKFKHLAVQANISNDHFVRTTDEDHKEAVQYFWHLLQDRGYIYESKHEGWYCVSDETYYPESAIEKRLDPVTGRTFMASQETGKEVEWTSEANYHFRLSAFKDRLLEHYRQNPDFIVPVKRMEEVESWVTRGLEDLSVSRPVSRLTWGIGVPQDESQTIYVWLDALVNYITKAGFPNASFFDGSAGWPADVHVIGKDIMRFHCIYWPAFLLALDLPLPKQILTHAHWTLKQQKMSKSVGNVVSPAFAINRFGVDTMRFYLAHDGGIKEDSDYGNQFIVERYKKCLSGGLGNLVQRLVKAKAWSVRVAVERARGGLMDFPGSKEQREHLGTTRDSVDLLFDQLNPRSALHEIMSVIFETNKYLHDQAPWAVIKNTDIAEREAMVDNIIFDSAEAVRVAGILLQPYMPTKAGEILDILGVDPTRRTFQYAVFGADFTYGVPKIPCGGRGAFETLFPPLIVEDE